MNPSEIETRVEKLERELEAERARTNRSRVVMVAGLLAAAIGVPFVARGWDPVPNVFNTGDVISADQVNANFDHLVNGIDTLEAAVEEQRRTYAEGRAAASIAADGTISSALNIGDVTHSGTGAYQLQLANSVGGAIGVDVVCTCSAELNASCSVAVITSSDAIVYVADASGAALDAAFQLLCFAN